MRRARGAQTLAPIAQAPVPSVRTADALSWTHKPPHFAAASVGMCGIVNGRHAAVSRSRARRSQRRRQPVTAASTARTLACEPPAPVGSARAIVEDAGRLHEARRRGLRGGHERDKEACDETVIGTIHVPAHAPHDVVYVSSRPPRSLRLLRASASAIGECARSQLWLPGLHKALESNKAAVMGARLSDPP